MFHRSNDLHSKPPKDSLHNKFNDYSNSFDNFLTISDDGDSRMDIANDSQFPSNDLPDFLFPNKFRYCGDTSRRNLSRPPIISLEDSDTTDPYDNNKKKKVTFNESGTLTRSLTVPIKSSNKDNLSNNHEILSEEKYWVLVFGFNDSNKKQVLEKLKSYGNIVKVTQRKGCTFLHAKYSNIICSRRVIEIGSFFINDNVLIGVQECFNTDFLENESELSEEISQVSTDKPRINTPLADCRKFDNRESRENGEGDSMFQKIINFLLY